MRKMFSKNQIEEMIQSGVSSGATKLYSHAIVDEADSEWTLINNSPESLVGKTLAEIQAIFSSSNCIKMMSGSSIIVAVADDSSDGFVYLSNDGPNLVGDDFDEVVSDEVTPL